MTTCTSTGETIEQRPLGDTGLVVSSVIAGAAGWQPREDGSGPTESDTIELLRALAGGGAITTIDTSNNYGFGASERRVRAALDAAGPSAAGLLVQTKADRARGTNDFSAEQIRRSLDQSRERLGMETLPMVYLHDPENTSWEAAMAPDGPVAALLEAREAGVIGHLGISGGPVALLERFVRTGHFEAIITHNRFTLVDRSAESLLDLAAERGIPVLNAAPYGGGLLTQWPPRTTRYAYGDAQEAMLASLAGIAGVCDEYGVPIAAAALQWSMRDPRVTATIVGMETLDDYERTLRLAAVAVPEEAWGRLAAVELDASTWQDARA